MAEAASDRQGDVDLARAAALSDGIFAVAMTLLPALRAIVIGFFVAAVFWRSRHAFFRCLAKGDAALMWLNFLLLFAVAVTPLSTYLLGNFHTEAVTVGLLPPMSR